MAHRQSPAGRTRKKRGGGGSDGGGGGGGDGSGGSGVLPGVLLNLRAIVTDAEETVSRRGRRGLQRGAP